MNSTICDSAATRARVAIVRAVQLRPLALQSALRMSEVVAVKRDPVGNVSILDQSRLPAEEKWLSLSTAEDVRPLCCLLPLHLSPLADRL